MESLVAMSPDQRRAMMPKPRVLVTGASGFIGGALVRELVARGYPVVAASRRVIDAPPGAEAVRLADLGRAIDFSRVIAGCESVIHCAARVHAPRARNGRNDSLAAYRAANADGTVRLAEQAAEAGVDRLVFVSTVKVHGDATEPLRPLTSNSAIVPSDAYGVSKAEAEARLRDLSERTGLNLVIVRPPLVYGPSVKGNFSAMRRWLARGIPLPLGAIKSNKRSLIAIDNLVDLLILCLEHPAAPNRVFLAADGEDLSTYDLLRRTAQAMGARPRLLPVPAPLLKIAAHLIGRSDLWQRLGGNLQVDMSEARDRLGWSPPITVDEGLARAVGNRRLER